EARGDPRRDGGRRGDRGGRAHPVLPVARRRAAGGRRRLQAGRGRTGGDRRRARARQRPADLPRPRRREGPADDRARHQRRPGRPRPARRRHSGAHPPGQGPGRADRRARLPAAPCGTVARGPGAARVHRGVPRAGRSETI
ncbi:MAG: hypothetical protein AVDCRST_MAG85-3512, partial [uncultured Solirubrobacteraceae bacterium]